LQNPSLDSLIRTNWYAIDFYTDSVLLHVGFVFKFRFGTTHSEGSFFNRHVLNGVFLDFYFDKELSSDQLSELLAAVCVCLIALHHPAQVCNFGELKSLIFNGFTIGLISNYLAIMPGLSS